MRSRLELRSPSDGTGWGETWSFSGRDDRLLRDCLDQLAEFATDPPTEAWDRMARRDVIRADDRWRAAMLLWPEHVWHLGQIAPARHQADGAWTADGALRLAEILPERLGDLRVAITDRFSPS